jgi:glycosyltransferase involved in cell wall biosynthesis
LSAEQPRVTVIVPTLNEEAWLPDLLDTLDRQTRPIHQLIVADADSTDATPDIARARGGHVVQGGHPGEGRNEGARHATGDWLLFLDADVRLPAAAIEEAFEEMARDGLDSASTWFVPDSDGLFLRFNHWISGVYFRFASKLGWSHSIGAFMLVSKAQHDEIGGFDVSITVAEDQDYVLRLSKIGRYGFMRRPVVEIAARRFEAEGSLKQSLKWMGIELHRLVAGEIRGEYFGYFKKRLPSRISSRRARSRPADSEPRR